jgi:hypothetical protein
VKVFDLKHYDLSLGGSNGNSWMPGTMPGMTRYEW